MHLSVRAGTVFRGKHMTEKAQTSLMAAATQSIQGIYSYKPTWMLHRYTGMYGWLWALTGRYREKFLINQGKRGENCLRWLVAKCCFELLERCEAHWWAAGSTQLLLGTCLIFGLMKGLYDIFWQRTVSPLSDALLTLITMSSSKFTFSKNGSRPHLWSNNNMGGQKMWKWYNMVS